MKVRKHLTNAAKFLVAGALIVWLILSGRLDFNLLLKLLTPYYIVCGFLIVFVSLASNNYRWLALLQGQGFKTDFGSTFRLTFIGMFFNIAMPGGVGGDLVKAYYVIKDHGERKMAAATSVLLDRLIGLFSMTCIGIVALAANFEFIRTRKELMLLAGSTTALFLAFVFLFGTAFSRRVKRVILKVLRHVPAGGFLARFYDVLASYRAQPSALARAMAASLMTQILTVSFFWLIGGALEARPISWDSYAFVVPLGLIAMAAPIAPAGIGVGQAAFFVLFNWYLGFESQLGPAAVTAYQIVSISWGLLGAYFYFRRKDSVPAEISA
ncbi:MAG TPA: lysylphosphatidylglycerol synthase transmembrane domain-containing protein [Bdellovibrionales bacterium]|nr:lysylphosphatidylglycerol synthase transmembrane domain-containing protein [Bdellovibrionales bacterium]